MAELKRCTKCGGEFPPTLEYFTSDRTKPDGLYSSCKVCKKRDRIPYEETHRAESRARASAYFYAHREQYRVQRKVYYWSDPERFRNKTREWHRQNYRPGSKSLYHHRHYVENKPLYDGYRRKRRAILKGSTEHHSPQDVEYQYHLQNGCCFYCGTPLNHTYEVDHVIPLSRGGSDAACNIVCACRTCNRRKGSQTPEEWLT